MKAIQFFVHLSTGKLLGKRLLHAQDVHKDSDAKLKELMELSPGKICKIFCFKYIDMSICATIYLFIYVVKFSIADVDSWEKNQKEQLLTNLSGMYIAIYAYICIYV